MPSVYQRIANPYMPNGTPNLTNAPTPMYAPGELGRAFNDPNTGLTYIRVLLDSGATSSTTIGAVKAYQLAFWKDRLNNIVTNDPYFNDTGTPANCVNRVAGVFQTAVTAAPGVNNVQGVPVQYYCDLLINGINQPVAALAASTCVQGAYVTADTEANILTGGGVVSLSTIVSGNLPDKAVLGICRSSGVSAATGVGTMNVDVTIGFID